MNGLGNVQDQWGRALEIIDKLALHLDGEWSPDFFSPLEYHIECPSWKVVQKLDTRPWAFSQETEDGRELLWAV